MSGIYPQLTCKEVKQILKTLGFEPRPRTSTSHEQWVKKENGKFLKLPSTALNRLSVRI